MIDNTLSKKCSLQVCKNINKYGANRLRDKFKVWSGLVLWHINHCWLFNAKFFYTYISNI